MPNDWIQTCLCKISCFYEFSNYLCKVLKFPVRLNRINCGRYQEILTAKGQRPIEALFSFDHEITFKLFMNFISINHYHVTNFYHFYDNAMSTCTLHMQRFTGNFEFSEFKQLHMQYVIMLQFRLLALKYIHIYVFLERVSFILDLKVLLLNESACIHCI